MASFVESMCMVYGCDELEANKHLGRCHTVSDKLLDQFVHIEGLSRLFDEHYIEFEWDMHSRMDFNKHKISYYRDHFFHQLRDCFMLYRLLSDEKIYLQTYKILTDSTVSKVSRYFTETLDKLTYNIRDQHRLNELLDHIMMEKLWNETLKGQIPSSVTEEERKKIKHFVVKELCIGQTIKISNDAYLASQIDNLVSKESAEIAPNIAKTIKEVVTNKTKDNPKQNIREYFSKYMILSIAFVSSLFHDIGYPVVHFMGFQP